MTAVRCSAALHRLMEWQMLEGMQRVVMNKDADRPLRRQVMGGVLDQMAEIFAAVGALIRFLPVCGLRSCLMHGGVRPFWRERRASRGFTRRNLMIHSSPHEQATLRSDRSLQSSVRIPNGKLGQLCCRRIRLFGGGTEESAARNCVALLPGLVSLPSRCSS